ncbi:MAG: hypothetical protein PUP90_24360 [Nostoc sp. S4]|nr:hypothetical protein [Nostoc sp. S4]
MSIEAIIQRQEKLTEVKVYTADSVLKQMEFEFPVTEFAQVDAARSSFRITNNSNKAADTLSD